jgi:ADP-ribose pyrophosphatase YjhB (NUDIX family)
LHKWEGFRIWSLPGGFLEAREGWEVAGVREVQEKMGHRIVVERFAGEYR